MIPSPGPETREPDISQPQHFACFLRCTYCSSIDPGRRHSWTESGAGYRGQSWSWPRDGGDHGHQGLLCLCRSPKGQGPGGAQFHRKHPGCFHCGPWISCTEPTCATRSRRRLPPDVQGRSADRRIRSCPRYGQISGRGRSPGEPAWRHP